MSQTVESLSFEVALERLESVVKELEGGETGLDRSLVCYEEGVRLLHRCQAILDDAERKIALLTGVDAQGNPVLQEFDATPTESRDSSGSDEPQAKKKRNSQRGVQGNVRGVGEMGDRLF